MTTMTTMLKAFLAAKVKDVKAPIVGKCLRAAQRATQPRPTKRKVKRGR